MYGTIVRATKMKSIHIVRFGSVQNTAQNNISYIYHIIYDWSRTSDESKQHSLERASHKKMLVEVFF